MAETSLAMLVTNAPQFIRQNPNMAMRKSWSEFGKQQ
jgi:hypothetical protein